MTTDVERSVRAGLGLPFLLVFFCSHSTRPPQSSASEHTEGDHGGICAVMRWRKLARTSGRLMGGALCRRCWHCHCHCAAPLFPPLPTHSYRSTRSIRVSQSLSYDCQSCVARYLLVSLPPAPTPSARTHQLARLAATDVAHCGTRHSGHAHRNSTDQRTASMDTHTMDEAQPCSRGSPRGPRHPRATRTAAAAAV